MIENALDHKAIRLKVHAKDWEDAIRKSAKPLLDNNKINSGYVDAMIEAVRKYGPYIVLTKNVALAHAEPSNNVKELAMSVLTLAEPIIFNHELNDPVKIVFTLAAPDNQSHLETMKHWIAIIRDESRVKALCECTTVEEFEKLFFKKN